MAWYAERDEADEAARAAYAGILRRDFAETQLERFEFAIEGERCTEPGARWTFEVAVKQVNAGVERAQRWDGMGVVKIEGGWRLEPSTDA